MTFALNRLFGRYATSSPLLRDFIRILCATGVAVISLTGCSASKMEIYPPVGGDPLNADEGLLIIHVETEVPLESVSVFRNAGSTKLPNLQKLPKGEHLWIIRAGAGKYEWSRVTLAPEVGHDGDLDLHDFRVSRRVKDWVWDDEFAFDVEAGKINYPGQLIILSRQEFRSTGRGYSIRNRNHSAMAIRELLQTHGELLRSLPLRYSGTGDDAFLDYYTRMRDASSADAAGGDQ